MRTMLFWAGLLAAYLNLSGAISTWAVSSEEASPAPKDEGRGPASGQKLLRRLAGRLQAALKAPGVQRKAAAEAAPVKPRRDPRGNRYEAPEKPDQALPAEDADA